MKKTFNNLAGRIATLAIELENLALKCSNAPIKHLKKLIDKVEQKLAKITNDIENCNLTDQQKQKLQQLVSTESDKMQNLKINIPEQQTYRKSFNTQQQCDKLSRLIKHFNCAAKPEELANQITDTQKTELLTQLKNFKIKIKNLTPLPSESMIFDNTAAAKLNI